MANGYAPYREFVRDEADSHLWDMAQNAHYLSWPYVKRVERIDDKELQRQGVDVVLTLKNGYEVTIDEKIDYHHESGNLYLEVYSSWKRKDLGWMWHMNDYVKYTFSDGTYQLIPMTMLHAVYEWQRKKWRDKYGIVNRDDGYGNGSSGIPVNRKDMLWWTQRFSSEEACPGWGALCLGQHGNIFGNPELYDYYVRRINKPELVGRYNYAVKNKLMPRAPKFF